MYVCPHNTDMQIKPTCLYFTANSDFTPNTQMFTVPAGSGPGDSINFEVTIIDDTLVENDEDISVTATILNGQSNMFADGTLSGSASILIIDNDGK